MASFYGGGGAAAGSGGGTSGVGISNIEINAKHHLIVFLTDGTRKDLGRVRGATFTPEIVNGLLTWANDAGLDNPEAFDFNSLLEDEGEMWFPVGSVADDEKPSDDTEYNAWERI